MINSSLPLAQSAMPSASSVRATRNSASTTGPHLPPAAGASFTENLSRLSGESGHRGSMYNPAQQVWLEKSQDNPELAERLISDMAELPTTIVYDVSDGNLRIANTGELASKEFENRFEIYRQIHDDQLRTLYESEKAKGTDPRDILKLMYNFENSAPDWFRVGSDPQYLNKRTFIPDEPSRTGMPDRRGVDVEALVEQLVELRADQKSLNRTSAAR